MKIIPVMDVLKNQVVHAVRGERANYAPIKSVLCKTSDPIDTAKTFANLGFSSMYLADLDAIQGGTPNLSFYTKLAQKSRLQMMIDAGIADTTLIDSMLALGDPWIIIGTETLTDMKMVKQITDAYPPERFIISLDLRENRILSKDTALRQLEPVNAVSIFAQYGIETFIVLDLSRVGTGQGSRTDLIGVILQRCPVKVIAGGGVKHLADLEALDAAGAAGVLVATALHNGMLSLPALARYSL